MGVNAPPKGHPVSFYVSDETIDQLRELKSLHNGSHSRVVREAVRLLHKTQIKALPVAVEA